MNAQYVARVFEPDADAFLALLHRAFAFMENRIDPPSSLHRLTAQNIRDFAADEVLLAVFDADKNPIACLFVTVKTDHLYLGKWAVDPHHRGQGLGRALLDWVEDMAPNFDATYLELETRIELTENHTYFARQGFAIAGETRHPGYSHTTGLTMRKTLNA